MSISRDRANRSGSDPLQIDNTKLVTDSGDLKIQDTGGNEKKLVASEIHVGTGADKVILKRDSATGGISIQTQAAGEAAEGGAVASTTIYATTSLLPTNPSDGQQALVTANNFLYIAKSNGWYKIAEITNTTPSITSAGNATYQFLTDGTPVSIEITATDAEVGTALQYKYAVSSGSIGSIATVTSSATSGGTYSALAANTLTTNKFFKVTPSTNNAHAGTFSLTFSASDGVAVGTSSASQFTLQFDVSGSYKVGPYNADTDYFSFPAHADFNFGSNNFTIEAWVWPDAAASDKRGGWIEWGPDDSSNVFRIFQGSSGQSASNSDNDLEALYVVGGTDQFEIVGQEALTPNTWNHIALQRISNTIHLFVDGVSKGSASYSGTVDLSSWVGYLGTDKMSTDRTATGYMSNVRVVNGSNVYTVTDPSGASSASASYGMLSTPGTVPSWGTTWTLETWIYITNSASYNTFFNGTGGFYIAKRGSGMETYAIGGFSDSPGSGTVNLNQWHHYAASNNNGSIKIFLDGTQIASGTSGSAPYGGTGTLHMMAQGGNTWPTFGYMSDTRLVIGTAVYSGNFTPPSGALTKTGGTYPSTTNVNTSFPAGHTYLLTNRTSSGTTISDDSDQNYTLVTAGALTGSTTKPFNSTITKPTDGLTAVANTKLLTMKETEPIVITNGSYNFTTVSSRLTATHAGFNWSNTDPFTYEMWYKFTGRSNSDCMFDFGAGNTFQMYVYNNQINVYGVGGGFVIQYGSAGYALNTWYHAAITGDGSGNIKAYIDGQQVGSTYASPGFNITGSKLRLNGYAGSSYTNIGITGFYSDIRFVNGTQVYTGNFTPPSGPLTTTGGTYPSNTNVNTSITASHTKFLSGQNSSGALVDNSTFGHSLTMDGTVTPSAGIEGAPVDQSSTARTISIAGGGAHSYVTPFAQGSGGAALFGEYIGANSTAVGTLNLAASSDFTLGTGDYCVDGWFKNTMPVNTSTTHNERLFELGDNNCRIFFKNGEIKAQTTGNAQMTYSPGADFGTDTWHHFALQRESATTRFFLDGSEKTSISDTQNHTTTACKIGGYTGDDVDSRKFKGYISDFRVVKGATAYTVTGSPHSGSIYLNGGSVSTSASSDFTMGTGDFTIETWFKYSSSSLSGNKYLVDLGANGIRLTFTSGHIYANDGGQYIDWYLTNDIGSISTSKWYHLAFVRNGTNIYLYFDGVQKGTLGSSTHNHSTNTFTLGNYGGGGSYNWVGYVSDFRIAKGKAVYTGAFSPPTGPLTTTGGTYPNSTNRTDPTASETVLLIGNNASSITDVSDTPHTMSTSGTVSANSSKPTSSSISVPTSKSTAITGTVLLTCQQSTGDFTDASSSNHTISQGATGLVLATRHQPY